MTQARTVRVLPTRERVEEELRPALGRDGLVLGGERVTAAEFFAAMGDDPGSTARLIGAAAERAILGRCALEVDLGPFARVRERPGFLRAARDLIASLKAGRCWSQAFDDAAARFPAPRGPRVTALARLYSAYEAALERAGARDGQDALAAAVARLRDARATLPRLVADAGAVVFEDLYDWTPLRLEILMALSARFEAEGEGRVVRLVLPHDPQRPELMAFVDPVWELVYRRAQEGRALELAAKTWGDDERPPARLAQALFRSPAAEWREAPAATLTSAATVDEEARDLARRVRDLVDLGANPDGIAVALRHPDADADRLFAALERYGVPVRLRRGAPLAAARLGGLAQSLATARADGIPLALVEALLGAGLPGRFVGRGGPILAALREAGVTSERGADGDGALRRGLEALERRCARTGDDAGAAKDSARAVEAIAAAVRRLPEGRAPLSQHARGLLAALDELGALTATAAAGEDLGSLRALARSQAEVRGLLACVDALVEAFDLAGRAAEALEPARFSGLLADALADARLDAPGVAGPAVRIVDVRELAGARVEHLFLPGLVDGRFPAAPEPHPLFPDEDRFRLNAITGQPVFRAPSGIDGPLPERQAEEPLLFHLALSSATSAATLSWSRADARGKETIPSRFVEEVRRVRGAVVEERQPRRVFPAGTQARAQDELLARAALESMSNPALRATEPDRGFDARGTWAGLAGRMPQRVRSIEARVEIERERFHFFATRDAAPGRFTGALQEAAAALAERFAYDAERPLSPKALSELGNCRFRGFASQVLRLRACEEAGAEADAATLGDLHHRALQALMLERRERGRLPLRGDADDLEALGRALAGAAQAIVEERPAGHPGLWSINLERAAATLARVVRMEAREPVFPGLLPQRFEAALGEAELPLLEVPGPRGEAPVFVGGRVDRIDTACGAAGAIDYKSSRADRLRARLKTRLLKDEFQLAVYAAALKASAGSPADAAFVSLRDATAVRLSEALLALGQDPAEVLAVDAETRARLRGREDLVTLGDAIWAIVDDARAGLFPARPLDCDFCPFGAVCRVGDAIELEESDE